MDAAVFLLALFYAGAVFITGRAWASVLRGQATYAELRDLTGITDRAALYRLFGATVGGTYRVTPAGVLSNRRRAGRMLGDVGVHAMFLLALALAAFLAGPATLAGVLAAAGLHAGLVALVAVRLALADPAAVAG
ncbi:hypothetical protein ACUN0C_00950 [Faunimonas sp. B44]|uniref:hypothetical protein n=1 Tax=Faunimonas sp. B44 TaxID=3461493 RepID=UPI0040448375